MATYDPNQLGIKPPAGGFKEGGWYSGRQYWGGTLSEPGVIHPSSNQQGAGQAVSAEVNAQSAAAQDQTPQQLEAYLQAERDKAAKRNVTPTPARAPGITDLTEGAAASSGGGIGITPAATLNLPDLYKSLTESSGVAEAEAGLKKKADEFQKAQMQINDNPFLSEATRVGRVAKLTTDYNTSIKNEQDALAMKKQDIATQLELATKQFDINSSASKQALDQFNVLLQSGALAGASGNDIAAITKATGISSSMIQTAIQAQSKKDMKTSVSTVDDGTTVWSVVIDSNTGDIISKQELAKSKPSTAQPSATAQKAEYMTYLREDAKKGVPLAQIFQIYTGYLDPNTILQLYNANSSWGPAKESYAELTKYGVKDPTKSASLAEQIVALQGGQ